MRFPSLTRALLVAISLSAGVSHAQEVQLEVTIASEATTDRLADIVVTYAGEVGSDEDFLKIATEDGIPLQSIPLGERGRAEGEWRLQVEADRYVVTWETGVDGTEESGTGETRALATRRFGVLLPPDETVAEPAPAIPDPMISEPDMAPEGVPTAGELRPGDRPGWSTYVNGSFGSRVSYPSAVFVPEGGPPRGYESGRRFSAAGGEAILETFSWNNAGRETMAGLRARLQASKGYERVTYRPASRSWFVLSGYRGDNIFYEKYASRDGGATVHAFAMEFPRRLKPLYGALLEEIENSFRAPG